MNFEQLKEGSYFTVKEAFLTKSESIVLLPEDQLYFNDSLSKNDKGTGLINVTTGKLVEVLYTEFKYLTPGRYNNSDKLINS